MLCQLVASDISLATSFSFHSKTHRALILLLLASKPDPLLLGSGLGPPLRGSFFLSQGNIDFNRLSQMDITQAPAFLKAALPSGCGCDVKTEPEIQGTSSLAIRLFCSLIWLCVFDTQLLIMWLLHRIEKMNVQAARFLPAVAFTCGLRQNGAPFSGIG